MKKEHTELAAHTVHSEHTKHAEHTIHTVHTEHTSTELMKLMEYTSQNLWNLHHRTYADNSKLTQIAIRPTLKTRKDFIVTTKFKFYPKFYDYSG